MPGAFSTAWPTPRIPVHHAQELPIGGKLPSYFLLKSLTQSFPLEWRDVLRYQRLRKLHANLHAAHCAPLLTLRGLSVQRRQLIATWSMGVPVLSAMYSRAMARPRWDSELASARQA